MMKIGKVTIDTNDLTLDEVENIIKELRDVRARKGEARSRANQLRSMVESMKEEGFDFCNRYSGEVFKPEDWLVYDSTNQCPIEGKWY